MSTLQRTPVRQKAKQLAKDLRKEQPDYVYLRELFRHLREELDVPVQRLHPEKLPRVPTEEEIKKYYEAVWQSRNMKHVILIKTLLYTGVRVSEVIHIKIADIDFERCQIVIAGSKSKKDRFVPFPVSFKEILAMYADTVKSKKSEYLFVSSRRKPYTDRAIRKILENYTEAAGIECSISPRKLRHFLFAWLKKQGTEDAFIQSYSGHDKPQSLEIYTKLSIDEGQVAYDDVIQKYPI
jgi:integrase/recombinase XerD